MSCAEYALIGYWLLAYIERTQMSYAEDLHWLIALIVFVENYRKTGR